MIAVFVAARAAIATVQPGGVAARRIVDKSGGRP